MFQFHPIAIPYFASCAMALYMAYQGRKIAAVRGTQVWGITMLFIAIWTGADGLDVLLSDLSAKLVLTRISYMGVIGTTVFWSYFVVVYSNNDRLITSGMRGVLIAIPVACFSAVLSLHLHPYFYSAVGLVEHEGISVVSVKHGPIFWMWAVYAYCAMFGSGVLLIQAMLKSTLSLQGQLYLVSIAALLPLISNLLYLTGNNFLAPFDPTSLSFAASGLLVGFSFRRFRFLEVVPVAHDVVVQHVNCGVVVVDSRGLVMEINPAAERILDCVQKDIIGQDVRHAFSEQRHLLDIFSSRQEKTFEIELGQGVFQVNQTPLADDAGQASGRIYLLYDITTLKGTQQQLSAANNKLKKLAETDSLTELYNRRKFFELAERELFVASEQGEGGALMLVDIDNFKSANDSQGHLAGDRILEETARRLLACSRLGDIVGRYGGDEFVVVVRNADENESLKLAQRLCADISSHLSTLKGFPPITVSIGVASYNAESGIGLKVLVERADAALYEAKALGRNQAISWRLDRSA